MLAGDVAALERLLDDALTYTHSSGVVDTKASYIAGVRDKVWEYKTITRENERVVIRGGCGLVFCRLQDRSQRARDAEEGRQQRAGGVGGGRRTDPPRRRALGRHSRVNDAGRERCHADPDR